MSLPVVEVICAPATEDFRANPRSLPLVAPTFDILKKVDGQIRFVPAAMIPRHLILSV